MMAEYFMTSEAISAARKILIRRLLFFTLILSAGGFCYGRFVLHSDTQVEVVMALLVIGVMVFSYFQNFKRKKLAISSYRLVLEQGCISRFQHNLPPIRLTADDIVRITENTQGVLTVASTDKYRAIYIPTQITNRAELLQELTALQPVILLTSKTFLEKIAPYTSVGVLGLMGVFYAVNNKVISTISGTVLLTVLAWSAWHIWRNKDLPHQSRRLLWFMPLVWLSILAGVIVRLMQ
jgi:hypothetical protein